MGTQLHLRFMGDWGRANLTRVCGWLASEVGRRSGDIHHVIHTGRGMGDNMIAVGSGEVDVAVATPAAFARMAREGRGIFEGNAIPQLRTVGNLPHYDALLVALSADLGIQTMAELREQKPKLRLALSPDDGQSFMGFGAASVLKCSGIDPQEILEWGGEFVFGEEPRDCIAAFEDGRANAVIQEAMMSTWWNELAERHELSFLSLEPEASRRLEEELGLATLTVEAGYLRGMNDPVKAVDFRGWIVLVRDDMDDSVAELLATALTESSTVLEDQYKHLDTRFSPLSYPITPEKLIDAPIPLHAGAARYYASLGLKPAI
jgi:TRAP-type uncharacterized transport system substrate-binding protein